MAIRRDRAKVFAIAMVVKKTTEKKACLLLFVEGT